MKIGYRFDISISSIKNLIMQCSLSAIVDREHCIIVLLNSSSAYLEIFVFENYYL